MTISGAVARSARRAALWEEIGMTGATSPLRGMTRMAIDRREQIREQLTHVYLAFQMLARRGRPWDQQQRIANIGLAATRKLAAMLMQGREPPSPRTRESAT
jgi:hypothetical protein